VSPDAVASAPILTRAPGEAPARAAYRPVVAPDSHYPLSDRFEVRWERSGDSWIARDVPTGIFGHGPTVEAAVSDLQRALREHLDVLEREPALSEALAQQLAYLRQRLR
jgi:predicted RNase H-like HicB family nuclease